MKLLSARGMPVLSTPSTAHGRLHLTVESPLLSHGACSWESWVCTTLVTSGLDVCAPHVLYNTP
eukprot:9464317-Pyramimonas_sp.AAC.1